MANPNGNTLLGCFFECKISKLGHMRMYYPVLRMILKKNANITLVPGKILRVNGVHTIYPAAQRFNFVIISAALFPVNKKVELHLCSVNMSIIVHHHGFGSAAIHNGKQIQHPNWVLHTLFVHPFILSIHFKSTNTPTEKSSLQQAKNTHQCGGK